MKTLMRNGRDRRSENPLHATRGKNACFWLGPISGSHQGPRPERLHLEAGYMAAPVSFRERSDSFPLHCGRRPYMARSVSAAHVRHNAAYGGVADHGSELLGSPRPGVQREAFQDHNSPSQLWPVRSRSRNLRHMNQGRLATAPGKCFSLIRKLG